MKKILFTLVALIATASMNAQIMKILKNGDEVATYEGADYTVVFEEESAANKVTPQDDWYNILKNAADGAEITLMPGEYAAYEVDGNVFSTLAFAKSITIKAANPSNKPVLKGINIKLETGVSLDLTNVILDGTNSEGTKHPDQAITTSQYAMDHIIVSGCEVKNYVKGVLYVNNATPIQTVDFNNCYFHDIDCTGGDGFDFRNGAAAAFKFTNNSVVNVASVGKRDVFRMDAGGNKVVPEGTITITNNNFENINNGQRRLLYVRLGDTFPITFSNNVVSNSDAYYTNQRTTKIAETNNNDYFNAPYLTECEILNAQVDATGTSVSIDPKYDENYFVTASELITKGIGNYQTK